MRYHSKPANVSDSYLVTTKEPISFFDGQNPLEGMYFMAGSIVAEERSIILRDVMLGEELLEGETVPSLWNRVNSEQFVQLRIPHEAIADVNFNNLRTLHELLDRAVGNINHLIKRNAPFDVIDSQIAKWATKISQIENAEQEQDFSAAFKKEVDFLLLPASIINAVAEVEKLIRKEEQSLSRCLAGRPGDLSRREHESRSRIVTLVDSLGETMDYYDPSGFLSGTFRFQIQHDYQGLLR